MARYFSLLLLSLVLLPSSAGALTGITSVDVTAFSVFDGVNYAGHDDSASGAPLGASRDVQQSLEGRTSTVVKVRASAASDAGQVHAAASTEFPGVFYCSPGPFCNGVGTVKGSARAAATQGATDIMFSGTGPITTNVTLDLSGSVQRIFDWIDGTTHQAYLNAQIPSATVQIDFNLSQVRAGNCEGTPCTLNQHLTSGLLTLESHYDGTTSLISSGFTNAPSSWANGIYHLQSQNFSVLPNLPVSMFFEILVDSAEQYSHSGGDHILSGLDFGHTFGLTTAGPVFSLGGGETVNSSSLQLASNVFTPVPEPGTALLVALGAGLLARARRGCVARPS